MKSNYYVFDNRTQHAHIIPNINRGAKIGFFSTPYKRYEKKQQKFLFY